MIWSQHAQDDCKPVVISATASTDSNHLPWESRPPMVLSTIGLCLHFGTARSRFNFFQIPHVWELCKTSLDMRMQRHTRTHSDTVEWICPQIRARMWMHACMKMHTHACRWHINYFDTQTCRLQSKIASPHHCSRVHRAIDACDASDELQVEDTAKSNPALISTPNTHITRTHHHAPLSLFFRNTNARHMTANATTEV